MHTRLALELTRPLAWLWALLVGAHGFLGLGAEVLLALRVQALEALGTLEALRALDEALRAPARQALAKTRGLEWTQIQVLPESFYVSHVFLFYSFIANTKLKLHEAPLRSIVLPAASLIAKLICEMFLLPTSTKSTALLTL